MAERMFSLFCLPCFFSSVKGRIIHRVWVMRKATEAEEGARTQGVSPVLKTY